MNKNIFVLAVLVSLLIIAGLYVVAQQSLPTNDVRGNVDWKFDREISPEEQKIPVDQEVESDISERPSLDIADIDLKTESLIEETENPEKNLVLEDSDVEPETPEPQEIVEISIKPQVISGDDGTYYQVGDVKIKMTDAIIIKDLDEAKEVGGVYYGSYIPDTPLLSADKQYVHFAVWTPPSLDLRHYVFDVEKQTTSQFAIEQLEQIQKMGPPSWYFRNIGWDNGGLLTAEFITGDQTHHDGSTNCFTGFRAASLLSDQPHRIFVDLNSPLVPGESLETHIMCSSI